MNKSLRAPSKASAISCDEVRVRRKFQIPERGSPSLDRVNDDDAFPIVVVIVYNDIRAALRASHTLERLQGNFKGKMRRRLIAVPVAQLGYSTHFDRLLLEANSADMIIVSFNGPGDFPDTLKKWVGNCLTQKREGDSAMVALLSSDERIDTTDSPRYQYLENATRAAGLSFFAPNPGKDSRLKGHTLNNQSELGTAPINFTPTPAIAC